MAHHRYRPHGLYFEELRATLGETAQCARWFAPLAVRNAHPSDWKPPSPWGRPPTQYLDRRHYRRKAAQREAVPRSREDYVGHHLVQARRPLPGARGRRWKRRRLQRTVVAVAAAYPDPFTPLKAFAQTLDYSPSVAELER